MTQMSDIDYMKCKCFGWNDVLQRPGNGGNRCLTLATEEDGLCDECRLPCGHYCAEFGCMWTNCHKEIDNGVH